jgi:hypothetical protein
MNAFDSIAWRLHEKGIHEAAAFGANGSIDRAEAAAASLDRSATCITMLPKVYSNQVSDESPPDLDESAPYVDER